MRYLFGDSDLAAQRLAVLADVFAESSRSFLLDAGIGAPHLALDLGCGPGYSTHFIADVLPCHQVVGLDNSDHFIALAKKSKTESVSFYLHDITAIPFPVEPADLLYCRFLMTHLKEPHSAILKWATQLRPQGFLLMEEVEWIHTNNNTFDTYLKIVATMLENQSNTLYVGLLLDRLEDSDVLRKRMSRIGRLQVSTRNAAKMFSMNIQSWKQQSFIRENYSDTTIEELEADLKALNQESRNQTETEWGLRQIV